MKTQLLGLEFPGQESLCLCPLSRLSWSLKRLWLLPDLRRRRAAQVETGRSDLLS